MNFERHNNEPILGAEQGHYSASRRYSTYNSFSRSIDEVK
jgi:hypothetical protein